MLVEVPAADVDDERQLRFEGDEVREALLRSDAEVHTARRQRGGQRGKHTLKRLFVRQEVIGAEVAVWLGELGDEAPELLITQTSGKGVSACTGARRRPKRGHADPDQ